MTLTVLPPSKPPGMLEASGLVAAITGAEFVCSTVTFTFRAGAGAGGVGKVVPLTKQCHQGSVVWVMTQLGSPPALSCHVHGVERGEGIGEVEFA